MAKEVLAEKSLDHLLQAVSHLVKLPKSQVFLSVREIERHYGAGTILYTFPVLPAGPTCSEVNTYSSRSVS